MPRKNNALHGNAPDSSSVAPLIIALINDLEFKSGVRLLPQALVMAKKLAVFRARAVKAVVPVIYVSEFSMGVRDAGDPEGCGS